MSRQWTVGLRPGRYRMSTERDRPVHLGNAVPSGRSQVRGQGRSRCRQSTRSGGATSPVSQRPVNVAPVPAVSPNMTKKGVALVTTCRVTAKDTKKTLSLLMRKRRSKHVKVSSKLEVVLQDLETDFSNENISKPNNSKQLARNQQSRRLAQS